MSKKIQLLAILTVLFLLPSVVLAANGFGTLDVSGGVAAALNLFFGPGAEVYTDEPTKILQYLIFPFIALWVVIYGILTNLKIFGYRRDFNALLSFLIAVIACPTGGLVLLVRYVFGAMGWWGFVGFAGLFFFGLVMWVIGDVIRLGSPISRHFSEAGRLEKDIYDIQEVIRAARAAGGDVKPLLEKLEKKTREWEQAKKRITSEHRFGS